MITKKKSVAKTVMALLVAMLLAGAATIPILPTYAAGGTATVKFSSDEPDLSGKSFDFNLYYVGGFKGILFQNEEFPDSAANVEIAPLTDEEKQDADKVAAWTDSWSVAAKTLAGEIKSGEYGDPDDIRIDNANIANGSQATFNLAKDGLYLLIGKSQDINGTKWTPVPTFIGMLNNKVLNQGTELTVKMDSEKIVYEHLVIKKWNVPEGESADVNNLVKPEKVWVKITYGSIEIDKVCLDDSNNWSYAWRSTEAGNEYEYLVKDDDGNYVVKKKFTPGEDKAWHVAEITKHDDSDPSTPSATDETKLRFYSSEVPETEAAGRFDITNTLSTKKIEIKKTIDGFYTNMHNVVFGFTVVGYDDVGDDGVSVKGNPIFRTTAGIVIGPEEDLTKWTEITDIPAAVKSIEVTEDLSVNYELSKPIEIIPAADGKSWTVNVENKHSGEGPGGGVVNKYRAAKDPEKDLGEVKN